MHNKMHKPKLIYLAILIISIEATNNFVYKTMFLILNIKGSDSIINKVPIKKGNNAGPIINSC
jgi:hypothetical protein